MERGGNTGYSYVPNSDIDRIIATDGKEYGQNVLLDGAYVTDRVRKPKMSRTQFEDETFEYGQGGGISKAESIKEEMYKAFESYLTGKNSDEQLISKLQRILGKRRWFRYFQGDTGASDPSSVKYGLSSSRSNLDYEKENMQYALDNRSLQIYDYSGEEMFSQGGSVQKVNLGTGEMDLEDAIKMYEDKIKAQGRIVNARDEDMLEQLKRMRNKYAKGGMTEHGLEIGDEIIEDRAFDGDEDRVVVFNHNTKEGHLIDLNRGRRFGRGGGIDEPIVRNKKENDWNGKFNFFLENNETPVKKGNLIEMAYKTTNGIDSAIPQSMLKGVDDTFFFVYDYQDNKFGELVDLRQKLKWSDNYVDVTMVVDGELIYGDELPDYLTNPTFHQAVDYMFKHDEVEAFDIRPRNKMAMGGEITAEERNQALKNSPKLNF
jgi:hypothetical protein